MVALVAGHRTPSDGRQVERTDFARLLGGLIAHLAAQVEKLASDSSAIDASNGRQHDRDGSGAQIADATQEEGCQPARCTRRPARDPNADGDS